MSNEHQRLDRSEAARRQATTWIYFRRFLKHPGRLASLTPSSQTLGRLVAQHLRRAEDEYVVDLGCGTGAITRSLLAGGVPPEKLIAFDLDRELLDVLRVAFPQITVVEGDAFKIADILPAEVVGKVGTVVCGVPISLMPLDQQRALTSAIFALMPPGRRFLLYTHRPVSPLPRKELGLAGERLARTLRNLPPASVWGYQRAS